MIRYIYNEDIADFKGDIIVNASNGIGWMGGKDGIITKKKGVAESLHYKSRGQIEVLAQQHCYFKSTHIFLAGMKPGTVFITEAPGLECDKVYHAVTMRFPGSRAKKKVIPTLVDEILNKLDAETEKVSTVAIPLLGCGTGKIDRDFVKAVYKEKLKDRKEVFYIYLYGEQPNT